MREKLSSKWLWFKIEMITENSTTNPPINKIVEVAFLILVPKISPREENRCVFLSAMNSISYRIGWLKIMLSFMKSTDI